MQYIMYTYVLHYVTDVNGLSKRTTFRASTASLLLLTAILGIFTTELIFTTDAENPVLQKYLFLFRRRAKLSHGECPLLW